MHCPERSQIVANQCPIMFGIALSAVRMLKSRMFGPLAAMRRLAPLTNGLKQLSKMLWHEVAWKFLTTSDKQ